MPAARLFTLLGFFLTASCFAPDFSRVPDQEMEAIWADAAHEADPLTVLMHSVDRLMPIWEKMPWELREVVSKHRQSYFKQALPEFLKKQNPPPYVLARYIHAEAESRRRHGFRAGDDVAVAIANNSKPLIEHIAKTSLSDAVVAEAVLLKHVSSTYNAPSEVQIPTEKKQTVLAEVFRYLIVLKTGALFIGNEFPSDAAAKAIWTRSVSQARLSPQDELKIYGDLLKNEFLPGEIQERDREMAAYFAAEVFRAHPELIPEYSRGTGLFKRAFAFFTTDTALNCRVKLGSIAKTVKRAQRSKR